MKPATLSLLAAAVILGASAWGIFNGVQNRRGPTVRSLELTERELRLPPVIGDSTALVLELLWRVDRPWAQHRGVPEWLDAAKLADLGFDCRLAATDPHARKHYAAMRARMSYVALRLEPSGTGTRRSPDEDGRENSRLVAVDAAAGSASLVEKYPAAAGHVVSRAVIAIHLFDHDEHGQLLPQPRLGGFIQRLVPEGVFVPRPGSGLLQGLRPHLDELNEKPREPRFAAMLHWGIRLEPWVTDVRLLTSAAQESQSAGR